MNYGEKFCNLAFDALCDEEAELRRLGSDNPSARPLSVVAIGEASVAFLIMKQALRDPNCPYVINEWPYLEGRRKADFCFSDRQTNLALASFELKVLSASTASEWNDLRKDVIKHLDPTNKIKYACDALERYCVVILTTKEDKPREESEELVREKILHCIPSPEFSTSDSIKLNPLRATDRKAQDEANLWNYLRVIVFTGEYVASAQSASAGNPNAG